VDIIAATPSEPVGPDNEARGHRPLTPAERLALARIESDEPLTDADVAALNRLEEGPDGPDADPREWTLGDPETGAPAEWMALSAEEQAWLDDRPEPVPARAEVLDAGFTHRSADGGIGFAGGGLLDRMEAGWELARAAEGAWDAGLDRLSDDELAGLACAARRNAARQAALELAVIGMLDARRAGPDGAPGEHVEDEVAALLLLTGWAAARRVALARALQRLRPVAVALAAGRIDADQAQVFADELATVDDDFAAAAIASVLILSAARWTTGELRHQLRQQIGLHDPEAAARRKEKGRKDARVDVWIDADGTGALAARGMDPAAAILADQALDADARWLQSRGVPGTLDQLRAQVVAARLARQPLSSLLLMPPAPVGSANGAAAAGAPNGAADTDHGAAATAPAWRAGLGGSVNLTMPLATWLGQADRPGEAAGYGTIDAATCRDLTAALATAGPQVRWCITLTGRNGQAVAHGCARSGPGPPGGGRASWLATIEITPIETGTCSHRRESAGYRPSPSLRHIVKVRSPRCGFPGCRRRAQRCDDDHTIPHHKGGKTCECNLYPLCRRHHRAKQAQGWRVTQPEPGVLIWTLPCGRHVTVTPDPHPA
jgi:hypothetical protein